MCKKVFNNQKGSHFKLVAVGDLVTFFFNFHPLFCDIFFRVLVQLSSKYFKILDRLLSMCVFFFENYFESLCISSIILGHFRSPLRHFDQCSVEWVRVYASMWIIRQFANNLLPLNALLSVSLMLWFCTPWFLQTKSQKCPNYWAETSIMKILH